MDLNEFFEEQKDKPPKKTISYSDLDEELLPINVYPAVVNGVIVYMMITEDGRVVPWKGY